MTNLIDEIVELRMLKRVIEPIPAGVRVTIEAGNARYMICAGLTIERLIIAFEYLKGTL